MEKNSTVKSAAKAGELADQMEGRESENSSGKAKNEFESVDLFFLTN